jgi:hypothetical protein
MYRQAERQYFSLVDTGRLFFAIKSFVVVIFFLSFIPFFNKMNSFENINATRDGLDADVVPANLVHFHPDKITNLTKIETANNATTCDCKFLKSANTFLLIGNMFWIITGIVTLYIFCLERRRHRRSAVRRQKLLATKKKDEKNEGSEIEMTTLMRSRENTDGDDERKPSEPKPSSSSSTNIVSSPTAYTVGTHSTSGARSPPKRMTSTDEDGGDDVSFSSIRPLLEAERNLSIVSSESIMGMPESTV